MSEQSPAATPDPSSAPGTTPGTTAPGATMRAVGLRRCLPVTDPESLVDVELPRPEVGPRDLLVEVRAVSVNPVDTKVRSGAIPDDRADERPDGVRVLGYDAAGVVVEVGSEVELFAVGDEVYYAGHLMRQGSDAELHAVDERLVGRKPSTLGFAEAAALPLTAITAWEGLFDKLRLHEASRGTLLLPGAAGGVGSMVLQLVRELLPGVRVVATASRAESRAWVEQLGAAAVVDHRADDLLDQVRLAAPDGVAWVFTSRVEQPGQLELYTEVLDPFGEIVAIDDPEVLDIAALKPKSLSVHWELMFTRALTGGEQQRSQHDLLDRVADLVDAGRVRSTATTVLSPIDAATLRRAHGLVEDGHVVGKVVVAAAGEVPA